MTTPISSAGACAWKYRSLPGVARRQKLVPADSRKRSPSFLTSSWIASRPSPQLPKGRPKTGGLGAIYESTE